MSKVMDRPTKPTKPKANLTLQQWGNSLAVRIPSAIAKSAHFSVGQPVEISIKDSMLIVKSAGKPKLSLSQKLALFNSSVHGGESMVTSNIGAEVI